MKTKIKYVSIAIAVVLVFLISGAFSYLTDTEGLINSFTVGEVSVEISEPLWNPENAKNIWGGKTIAKNPMIENTGMQDAYTYFVVKVPKATVIAYDEFKNAINEGVPIDTQLLNYTVNPGWTLIDSDFSNINYNSYTYAYDTELSPGLITDAVFDSVTYANVVEGELTDGTIIDMRIEGYAIQSNYGNGATPVTAAFMWDALSTQKSSTIFRYVDNGDSTVTITGYNGISPDVTFPASIAGSTVIVGNGTPLSGMSSVTSITFSDGIGQISANAFSGCTQLRTVSIPETVASIGASAFSGCTGILSIKIPISFNIDDATIFSGCTAVNWVYLSKGTGTGATYNETTSMFTPWSISSSPILKINIDHGTTSVGSYMFYNNENLTSAILPTTLSSVGDCLFKNCLTLQKVQIPTFLTAIGDSMFMGCAQLVSVVIPETTTEIGNSAFEGSGIKGVSLPISVESVGQNAFASSGIKSLIIRNPEIVLGAGAFANTSNLTAIKVSSGIVYGSSVFDSSNTIESVILTTGNVTPYDATTSQNTPWAKSGQAAVAITLEGGVTAINAYEFYNCACIGGDIDIPATCLSIGDSAFYGTSASKLTIYNDAIAIYGSADAIPNTISICARTGSTAETYATTYGNAFTTLS